MADLTPNYALRKPGGDDFYDIGDFNHNADIIDGELFKRPLAEDVWAKREMRRVNWKSPPDPAHYIHVSASGSDSGGDGTASAPYATLGKAVEAGSLYTRDSHVQIELAAGDYYEGGLFVSGAANMLIEGPATSRAKVHFTSQLAIYACPGLQFLNIDIVCDYDLVTMGHNAFFSLTHSKAIIFNCNISSSLIQQAGFAILFSGCTATIGKVPEDAGNGTINGFPVAVRAHAASTVYCYVSGSAGSTAYSVNSSALYVLADATYKTILAPAATAVAEAAGGRLWFSHLQGTNNAIYIYASPDGDDRNWGQTAAHPVKTIARARDIVQRCEGTGSIIIRLADGAYVIPSTVVFTGISRNLTLVGSNAANIELQLSSATGIGVHFTDCASVELQNITARKTVQNNSGAISCTRTKMSVIGIRITADQSQTSGDSTGIICDTGDLRIWNSEISNMGISALALSASIITANNNTGSGNGIGYYSNNGIFLRSGSMPTATTPLKKAYGGQISDNGVWV